MTVFSHTELSHWIVLERRRCCRKNKIEILANAHCVKSVRIRSFTGPYFPGFGLNTDQKKAEYEHFSRSGKQKKTLAENF